MDLPTFADHVRERMELTVPELPTDRRLIDDLGFDSIAAFEVLVIAEELVDAPLDHLVDLTTATLEDLYRAVCTGGAAP